MDLSFISALSNLFFSFISWSPFYSFDVTPLIKEIVVVVVEAEEAVVEVEEGMAIGFAQIPGVIVFHSFNLSTEM